MFCTRSEIDNAPAVIRDVCQALRRDDASPLDCSVRLTVGDEFEGTGWMRFADGYAECETYNRKDGRISQKIDTPIQVRWLQSHPIVGDALLMKLYDLGQGPGQQVIDNIILTSPDHRGATGPQFFEMNTMTLVYVGDEEIEVAAGKFSTHHFQVSGTADEDYILLRAGVGGYMQTQYELIELKID